MSFLDKFTQDNKYRKIYGLGLPGDPAGAIYILEFLIPRVRDPKILAILNAKNIKLNRT